MPVAPIQTFYVPLPQEDLYDSLSTISNEVQGSILAGIGIAIAAPGTIIYYDHWEDGYEVDVTQPSQSTTEIWGDGDLTNGVAPGTTDDLFSGGDVVDLINTIPIPRNPSEIYYDGGDRIQASFPIAVTTGSYAQHPGSYLAGATEVFDTDSWSTDYIIPVGENTPNDSGTDPFEYTAVYVMAAADNTSVAIKDETGATVTTTTLGQGETFVYRVGQGYAIEASKPVQAQLITGDINEQYEMRWYSLTPTDKWSDEYYSPVAEEVGSTGFWFYNPTNATITIHYDYQGAVDAGDFDVDPGEARFVEVDDGAEIDLPGSIGETSGLRFYSEGGENFFALAQIDADDRGATFDWGIRLLTPDELTPQVLVGLGFGNSTNDPNVSSRSVVWVTPVADAIINVDFDGDGVVDATIEADALEAVKIDDDSNHFPGAEDDQDMSGASIWAVDTNGDPVDIAVAWGQDPSRSQDGDTYALDLGTLVPPLPGLTAAKTVTLVGDVDGDGKYDPGDTIEYTITVLNFTRVDIATGGYSIVDDFSPVFDNTTYLAGSTAYTYATAPGPDGIFGTADDVTTTVPIADNGSGTPFPLDSDGTNNGFLSADTISGYERQTFTFQVTIADFGDLVPGTTEIVNTASLRVNDESIKDLEVDVPLEFESGIEIVKYTNGHDANVFSDVPLITIGDAVTWTYEVANTGSVYLANVAVVDDAGTPDGDDDFSPIRGTDIVGNNDDILEPGEVWSFEASDTAAGGLYRNVATVTADPVYGDGSTPVADLPQATDSDPSAYLGIPAGRLVSIAFDKQAVSVNGVAGAPVTHAGDVITYELRVGNTGDVPLPFINVRDPLLEPPNGSLGPPIQTGGDDTNDLLDVGELWTYTGTYTVQQADLESRGTLEPDDVAEDIIDNTASLYVADLFVSDDSAQVPIVYECGLSAVKTVVDVGGKGAAGAIDGPGEVITYEIAITNTGSLGLTGIDLDDPLLEGPNGTVAAPVESMNADGVLEVGETWTYTGTYTVDAATYYALSWENHFASCFVVNVATVSSDQGCSATSNQTRTKLFSGDIICGDKGKDVIDDTATGDMRPTEGGDIILGGRGKDLIDGLGGNDWIDGGKGKDKLIGSAGNDAFVFSSPVKNDKFDKIMDYTPGEDRIILDSAIFKKLDPGVLKDEYFAKNKARDKNDRIILDKEKQKLIYDKNGSKKGDDGHVFAKLKGDIGNLDADDFFVV